MLYAWPDLQCEKLTLKNENTGPDAWKATIPGKPVLSGFAGRANIPLGRLKSLYIAKNAAVKMGAFNEIETIFQSWASE